MESLFDYMLRHLDEYRKMQPITVVPIQHMFPGCHKYKPCCSKIPEETMDKMQEEIDLRHRVYKVKKQNIIHLGKPDGFDGF